MKIAVFAIAALLTGCEIAPYEPPPLPPVPDYKAQQQLTQERLDARMSVLQGQNIHMAIQMFGYPTSEREIAGDKVYTWVYNRPITLGGDAMSFSCTIELGTDQADTIKSTHWEGNFGGCANFARPIQ